jgi:hypothetical protein
VPPQIFVRRSEFLLMKSQIPTIIFEYHPVLANSGTCGITKTLKSLARPVLSVPIVVAGFLVLVVSTLVGRSLTALILTVMAP